MGEGEGTRPSHRWWVFLGSLVVHNPHNPPHKWLLVRLGQVVCCSSSGWVVSFLCRCHCSLSFCCPPHHFVALPIVLLPSLSFRVPRHFVSLPIVLCPLLFCFCPPHHFVVPTIHPASKWLAGEGQGLFHHCHCHFHQ